MNTRAGGMFFRWFTPGASGLALWVPLLVLLLKGFGISGLRPLDMPSNWISIHPGLPASWVNKISARCKTIAEDFIESLIDGKKVFRRAIIDIPIDILLAPIAFLYYFIGRFFLAKTFIYSEGCNECRICGENCPVSAIKFKDNKPFWSYNCESCMRCVNICPHKAIQCSHLLFTIAIIISNFDLAILVSRYFDIFPALSKGYSGFIIDSILALSMFFIVYRLAHKFLAVKLINKIFKYTSLTNYWSRYRAPGVKTSDFRNHK
jgi:ferredoxin